MKVIVAGYSKTGTKTLNLALTILGYKVYDYVENLYYLHKEWNRIFERGVKPGDLERMYAGVDAVCDSPCSLYWRELSEAFPDAKIVLMVRDEESWYKSALKQNEEMNNSWTLWAIELWTISGLMRRRFRYNIMRVLTDVKSWPSNKLVPHNENTFKRTYRQHNLYVQATAPKDRLLVFNVSDGWKPLCQFLGVEIPNKPFPHENKGGRIFEDLRQKHAIVIGIERELKITLSVFVAFLATIAYCLYQHVFSYR